MIICSFSFKEPIFGDIVFDARKLWNPHHNEALRPLDGRHLSVQKALCNLPSTISFLEECVRRLDPVKDQDIIVAVGCVGGRHRSVFVAEFLAKHYKVPVEHIALNNPPAPAPKPLKGELPLPLIGGDEE